MITPEQDLWELLQRAGETHERIRPLKGFGRSFRLLGRAILLISEARDVADETQRKLQRTGKWPKLDPDQQERLFQ